MATEAERGDVRGLEEGDCTDVSYRTVVVSMGIALRNNQSSLREIDTANVATSCALLDVRDQSEGEGHNSCPAYAASWIIKSKARRISQLMLRVLH